jgi:hypothetical protein
MNIEDAKTLITKLTGRPVRGEILEDKLRAAIANDDNQLDYAQFNELLLNLNKDRVERPFFSHFFGSSVRVGDLKDGIESFRTAAMLRFGNFIHAFKTWSRITDCDSLAKELEGLPNSGVPQPSVVDRSSPTIDITAIPEADTYFIGETTSPKVLADGVIKKSLQALLNTLDPDADWADVVEGAKKVITADHHPQLLRTVKRYRELNRNASVEEFREQIDRTGPPLEDRVRRCNETTRIGGENLDVYLAWDHMDVYIATSMRERHDFESVHRFAQDLMAHPNLRGAHEDHAESRVDLNLRFFDPTQSKAKNRVNKGLVEALMLKRSLCTVYSVQDSDTLGKDSELAATLAQGKPVIAYIPQMETEDLKRRKAEVLDSDVSVSYNGYSYLCHVNDRFKALCEDECSEVIQALKKAQAGRFWESDDVGIRLGDLPGVPSRSIEEFAEAWARTEKENYDKRARVLNTYHPLAFQVDLSSGVANGVLIARTVGDCARLIYSIALNRMEFYIDDAVSEGVWYLREKETHSPFRVVTGSEKLTNSFWNFYVR